MKKFFTDFKKFIAKGNIIDLAVAVIIGGAFGKIVTSLVGDIIMPLISLAMGGKSVSDWKWVIKPAVYEDGVLVAAESALKYGNFIQTILDFLIIALCIFIMIKLVMGVQKNISKGLHDIKAHNDKERIVLIKTLKAEGKTKKEIKQALILHDEQKASELKAAEENAVHRQTGDEILAEIRDLIKAKQTAELNIEDKKE